MRILTGVQPSGHLHWGNYFGAMKPIIDSGVRAGPGEGVPLPSGRRAGGA